MVRYRQKVREFLHYNRGKRVIELILEPKKSCRYYWKALISVEGNGYQVRFYDRFGVPYGHTPSPGENTADNPIFRDLEAAKIHVRRTLLNQES